MGKAYSKANKNAVSGKYKGCIVTSFDDEAV